MTADNFDEIVNANLPTLDEYEQNFSFFMKYFDPRYIGSERVPKDKPCLFVANHSLLGFADAPVGVGAYRASGSCPRGMGDKWQENFEITRNMHHKTGSFPGSFEACDAVMKAGHNLILFPGGQREVFKKSQELYKLVWKKRLGFIRLAVMNDYLIIPTGAVGGDELYTIMADSDDYVQSRVGQFLDERNFFDTYLRGKDELPPLIRGIGPTLIPKPKRLYVAFGKPVDLSSYKSGIEDEKKLFKARGVVERAIYKSIEEARKARQDDPEKESFLRKFLNAL